MKEYVAGTGGRYTYVDDLLNLQELALSQTSIYEGCSNFVISGCKVSEGKMTSGYVWLNGKIRYFEGANNISYPYYIYESNSTETIAYANDVNKKGRNNFLCKGATSVPNKIDPLSNKLPDFIEIIETYTPSFIDKFMGHYAVLSNSPFSKQTLQKDLLMAGSLSVDKAIETKTAFIVKNTSTGSIFKTELRDSGEVAMSLTKDGISEAEIVLNKDKSISFLHNNIAVTQFSGTGVSTSSVTTANLVIGSLHIKNDSLSNQSNNTDEGAINFNQKGYAGGNTRFRNFNVYNGKIASIPVFHIVGKTDSVHINGFLEIKNSGLGLKINNPKFSKTDKQLTNAIQWTDNNGEVISQFGFIDTNTYDLSISNGLGNLLLSTKGYVNIQGELWINGVDVRNSFVSQLFFSQELAKKQDKVNGKQLTTEDFTTALKTKLDNISSSTILSKGEGYVSAKDVSDNLDKKLNIVSNLGDVNDKAQARENLGVYSKIDSNSIFLKTASGLNELISLTADEINGLTPEQASKLKADKQSSIRNTLDAEQKGLAAFRLAKTSNLSDLQDKKQARGNLSVYSVDEMDKLLAGKLSNDAGYQGVIFTSELRNKLDGIKTGNFVDTDAEGNPIKQTEGYALISHVVKELSKKANLLLNGYNVAQKATIVENIGVYSKEVADNRFASVGGLFQDYITHLVKEGKSTADAQSTLRDKLNVPSKEDLTKNYLRKDGKLTDLSLSNADARKAVCNHLGAAFAPDFQAKLLDSGWQRMANSGSGTDTSQLYIRQIGDIVCIQGIVNTGKRDGSNWGGVVAVIPNSISPPRFAVRVGYEDFDDDHRYNRGSSFVISGNSRRIQLYESGWKDVKTEINFTYMV